MKNKQISLFSAILLIAIVVILAVSTVFLMQTDNINKQYEYESAITPTPSLAPPQLYAKATEPLLRMGSISNEVKDLQQKLKDLGYYGGDIDGQFGSGTKNAVMLFQKQHELTADGLAGKSTLNMLYSEKAHKIVVTPEPILPDVKKEELPMLVNRNTPLADNYAPDDLITISTLIDEKLAIIKDEGEKASKVAIVALSEMLKAAHADGLTTWQISEGYRTMEEQQALFDKRKAEYESGEETGNSMSAEEAAKNAAKDVAPPNTSEHQTGLAFDITVPGKSFADTEQAKWLAKNCWEYGFIIRYQLGKEHITGFNPEPWHIRYVGKQHSIFMRDADIALEEYLQLQQNKTN